MKDNKEKSTPYPVAFFDADNTLWQTVPDTYVSEGVKLGKSRTFSLNTSGEVVREEDGAKFILKDGVKECLQKLQKEGIGIGIISDNIHEDVIKVAELLGIKDFFEEKLTNIWFWLGPADKGLMISEINDNLGKNTFLRTLLVDDKDYSKEMDKLGYAFIQSPKDTFPKDLVFTFFGLK